MIAKLRLAVPLAVLSGLLYVLSFPGVGLWPLAYVALAPLLYAIRGRSPARGAALGLAAGTVTTTIGFSWLLDTLRTYSGFPTFVCLILLLLLSVYQAGQFAVFAALVCGLSRRGWPWIPSVAAAFATSEITYPLLFPWFFGASLHPWPVLIQSADLGGPVLVGLPLAIVGAAVAQLVPPRTAPLRPSLITAASAVLLPVVYGMLMIPVADRDIEKAPKVRIGLVQGNIPMPPVSADVLHERFAQQVRLSQELASQGANLVIWPESAFVHVLAEASPEEMIHRTEAGSLDVPLILGALVEAEGGRLYNTALMVDAHGNVTGRYDKHHLLPFGEYIPFGDRFPVLYRLSPASGRISPGTRRGPLPFEDKRITALICYEDILPDFVRDAVREQRPHLLVNLTNDAWFGTSREPAIHLALAKLRAVEHRRYLARATNTGRTALIDPVGREVARAAAFRQGWMIAEARWMHGWTLYGFWGNGPWYVCVVLSLVGLLIDSRWRRSPDTDGL